MHRRGAGGGRHRLPRELRDFIGVRRGGGARRVDNREEDNGEEHRAQCVGRPPKR
eukprot:COSAG04_NODE_1442_length_6755_cov_3.734225_1_plen_55_part_00